MVTGAQDEDRLLEECLGKILAGQETVESALWRYPERIEELRPMLVTALWLKHHSNVLDPRPGFVRASRHRLVARLKQRDAFQPAEIQRKAQPRWPFFQKKLNFNAALITLALVISLFWFGSALGMASKTSLPGEVFFPVKLAIERTQLLVSLDEANDTRLYIALTQNRSEEIHELLLEGKYTRASGALDLYRATVNETIHSIEKVARHDPVQAEILGASLKSVFTNQKVILTVLLNAVPQEAKPAIQQALQISVDADQNLVDLLSHMPPVLPTNLVDPRVSATHTPTYKPTSTRQAVTLSPVLTRSAVATVVGPSYTPTQIAAQATAVETILSTKTPKPSNTSKPTHTSKPANTSKPSNTPRPTNENRPVDPGKPARP